MTGKDGRGYAYGPPKKKTTPAKRPTGRPFNDSAMLNQQLASNPTYQNARAAVDQVGGVTPRTSDYWTAVTNAFGRMQPTSPSNMYPTLPTPTTPSSDPSGRGPSGGGAGAGAAMQKNAALQNFMAQLLNRPADNTFADALTAGVGEANAQMDSALANFKAGLAAQANPYTQMPVVAPQLAGNAMADFMRMSGASQEAVNANQAVNAEANRNVQAANTTFQQQLAQAAAARNAAMSADADYARSQAANALAANTAGLRFQDAQAQKSDRRDMLMQLLQLMMQNPGGFDLSKLNLGGF